MHKQIFINNEELLYQLVDNGLFRLIQPYFSIIFNNNIFNKLNIPTFCHYNKYIKKEERRFRLFYDKYFILHIHKPYNHKAIAVEHFRTWAVITNKEQIDHYLILTRILRDWIRDNIDIIDGIDNYDTFNNFNTKDKILDMKLPGRDLVRNINNIVSLDKIIKNKFNYQFILKELNNERGLIYKHKADILKYRMIYHHIIEQIADNKGYYKINNKYNLSHYEYCRRDNALRNARELYNYFNNIYNLLKMDRLKIKIKEG